MFQSPMPDAPPQGDWPPPAAKPPEPGEFTRMFQAPPPEVGPPPPTGGEFTKFFSPSPEQCRPDRSSPQRPSFRRQHRRPHHLRPSRNSATTLACSAPDRFPPLRRRRPHHRSRRTTSRVHPGRRRDPGIPPNAKLRRPPPAAGSQRVHADDLGSLKSGPAPAGRTNARDAANVLRTAGDTASSTATNARPTGRRARHQIIEHSPDRDFLPAGIPGGRTPGLPAGEARVTVPAAEQGIWAADERR